MDLTGPNFPGLFAKILEIATDDDPILKVMAANEERQRNRLGSTPTARDDIHHLGVPLTVLINPVVVPIGNDKVEDFEGCLSVPGMRGKVSRYQKIEYSGFDEYGNEIRREAEGWHARLVQHEFDHLNGVLYPELMAEEDKLLTLEQWKSLTTVTPST